VDGEGGMTLSVKNFAKFQHYKDRSPPWIKLYNELLDDYEFGKLPDTAKAHLTAIWLLASRYDNKIPHDAEWIARRINANSPVDIPLLLKAGFLETDQDCSEVLADCKQDAMPETERETEVEIENSSSSARKKTRFPQNFSLEERFRQRAISELGLSHHEIDDEVASAANYYLSRDGPKSMYVNWQRAIWDWLRRSKRFNGKNRQAPPRNSISEGFAEIRSSLNRRIADEEGAGGDEGSGEIIEFVSGLRQGA
jgi:hypothetical protein